MNQYKGLYIDGTIYTSEADIDKALKAKAIEAYKVAAERFNEEPSYEAALYMDEKAEVLVNNYGFTWDEVDTLAA